MGEKIPCDDAGARFSAYSFGAIIKTKVISFKSLKIQPFRKSYATCSHGLFSAETGWKRKDTTSNFNFAGPKKARNDYLKFNV